MGRLLGVMGVYGGGRTRFGRVTPFSMRRTRLVGCTHRYFMPSAAVDYATKSRQKACKRPHVGRFLGQNALVWHLGEYITACLSTKVVFGVVEKVVKVGQKEAKKGLKRAVFGCVILM